MLLINLYYIPSLQKENCFCREMGVTCVSCLDISVIFLQLRFGLPSLENNYDFKFNIKSMNILRINVQLFGECPTKVSIYLCWIC